jgi:hypothetical protein
VSSDSEKRQKKTVYQAAKTSEPLRPGRAETLDGSSMAKITGFSKAC